MFTPEPNIKPSLEDRYTADTLVRAQLERIGLGAVADLIQKPGPAMAAEPSVSMPRRRARPFTEMEATVVAQDDADYATDLIQLTRQLEGDAAEQAQRNSELYKLLMQSRLG